MKRAHSLSPDSLPPRAFAALLIGRAVGAFRFGEQPSEKGADKSHLVTILPFFGAAKSERPQTGAAA